MHQPAYHLILFSTIAIQTCMIEDQRERKAQGMRRGREKRMAR
jgi:hypothetical protein